MLESIVKSVVYIVTTVYMFRRGLYRISSCIRLSSINYKREYSIHIWASLITLCYLRVLR